MLLASKKHLLSLARSSPRKLQAGARRGGDGASWPQVATKRSHWIPGVALTSLIALFWLRRVFSDSAFQAESASSRPRQGSSAEALALGSAVFCHVGKAGGNTFRALFKGHCQADRKQVAEGCEQVPQSSIAGRAAGRARDENFHGPIERADGYLYNLRHPVDRMTSRRNYEHPGSCVKSLGRQARRARAARRETRKRPGARASAFFNECFPTQKDLPFIDGNLTGHDTHRGKGCLVLAREVINGEHGLKGFKRVFYNVHRYAKATIDKHPERSVIVIRTESLWQGLKDLDVRLGGNGNFGAIEGARGSRGSEKRKKSNATFSAAECGRLCCAIEKEMSICRHLVELAVNLDEAETEATTSQAASKRGFDSPLSELVSHCASARAW